VQKKKMADEPVLESPRKRLKLSDQSTQSETETKEIEFCDNNATAVAVEEVDGVKYVEDKSTLNSRKSPSKYEDLIPLHTREIDVGITEYLSKHEGFHGVLKQRYVDFLVNERDVKGNLVQLTNTVIPREGDHDPKQQNNDGILCDEDIEKVKTVLESEDITFCITLGPDDDKEHRTKIHRYIKEKFPSLGWWLLV
jgi:tRNA pseudouridine13 synthase